MSTGRTPTLTITDGSETVTLEDIRSAYPFPAISVQREFTEKKTRASATGAGKTIRVYRQYSGAEETIRVSVPYLSSEQYNTLRGFVEANPPTVSVSYLHWSVVSCDMVSLDPIPDPFDWVNDKSFQTSFELRRNSA